MGNTILYAAMFSASVLSGMLGIGVAFAAVPILGLTGASPASGIVPLALFLNGVTALAAALAFARAGCVDWQQGYRLAIVTSVFAPLGAWGSQWVHEGALWATYFAAVLILVYLLLNARTRMRHKLPFEVVLLVGAPVAAISGLLGVGPGFLLVPVMLVVGFKPRAAAALNAVAVTPASFLSIVPHLDRLSLNPALSLPLVLACAAGALLGGYLSSSRVSEAPLRSLFVAVIVALSLYKGISLEGTGFGQAIAGGDCPKFASWLITQAGRCGPPR